MLSHAAAITTRTGACRNDEHEQKERLRHPHDGSLRLPGAAPVILRQGGSYRNANGVSLPDASGYAIRRKAPVGRISIYGARVMIVLFCLLQQLLPKQRRRPFTKGQ